MVWTSERTSEADWAVWPSSREERKRKPGALRGGTAKMPLTGRSWAPNVYSTPWTGRDGDRAGTGYAVREKGRKFGRVRETEDLKKGPAVLPS